MKTIKLGNQELDFTVPAVMGILNVTPDSFYDGGRYLSEVKIVERIHQIMDEGAGHESMSGLILPVPGSQIM